MEMPEEVAIKALANGEPLEGAALNLTLATTRNGLSLLCRARTNAQGDVRLSGSDLKRWEAETRSLAMMDYGPLTGELHVAVVNRADIASRREGYRTWGAKYFHDDYIIWLDAVEATLQQVSPNTELRAVVGVSGGSVTALGSTRSA